MDCQQKYSQTLHQNACDSNIVIASSSHLGITQMSMNGKTDKLCYIHIMHRHTAMRTDIDTKCNNMDDVHSYKTEQRKPSTEDFILYESISIKSTKKERKLIFVARSQEHGDSGVTSCLEDGVRQSCWEGTHWWFHWVNEYASHCTLLWRVFFLFQKFGNLQQFKQISDPTTWVPQGWRAF